MMKKSEAIFPIVLSLDLTLSFAVPLIGVFVSSLVMAFFLPIIGAKKTLVVYLCEGAIEFLRLVVMSGSLLLSIFHVNGFTILISMWLAFSFLVAGPILTVGLTYIEYFIYRRLFKKWYKMIEAVT